MGGWVGGRWGLLLSLLCCHLTSAQDADPLVTGVTPKYGSRNGGTRITAHGVNFVDNFDPNNDPNVGTYIKLVAGNQHLCDLHVDGVTAITSTCYTRPMPAGRYLVRVTVNGKPVSEDKYCPNNANDCVFEVRDANTPKIKTLMPRSGVHGTLLTAEARMFTSRYGSNELSQNGRDVKIAKFWAAGKICNVKDLDTDQLYGLNLYNDSNGNAGDDGYFKCKPDNRYIGNYNISFIVEEYGRSLPDPTLLHVHRQGIGMYQMYTEVEGLSANSGSTEGGLFLTVTGQNFDDTDSPARVLIDGEECRVQEPISSTAIVCETPPPPAATPPVHAGNRGWSLTVVEGTTDYDTADWNSGQKSVIDESYHVTENVSSHVTKMAGLFVAPETGRFRFYLKVTGSGKMTLKDPSNNAQLITLTSNGQNAESDVVNLTQNKGYMVEVLAGKSGDSEVKLSARHYETVYLASQTGAAKAERQALQFNSVVSNEIQRLEVSSNGRAPGVSEVQVVEFTGDLDASFRLGLYGDFTEWLRVDGTSEQSLANTLSDLPSVAGESVSVAAEETATSRRYTITFPKSLGNVKDLETETTSEECVGSVSTTTQGQSKLDTIRLRFGGTVTKPISVDASPEEVEAALEESAGVRCHKELTSGNVLMDCETPNKCSGERVGYEEPFCGRFSAKNPAILYRGSTTKKGYRISFSKRMLCLAHKGPLTSIWMSYLYVDIQDEEKSGWVSFPIEVPDTKMNQWLYSCVDLLSKVKKHRPGMKDYYVQRVGTRFIGDIFVDQMALRGQVDAFESSAPAMRMHQSRPNSAFIKDIDVTGSPGNYTVEIIPYLCGHAFELISVEASQLSGSIDAESASASHTSTVGNKAVTVTTTRLSRASPPMDGKFSVLFGGKRSPDIIVAPDSREEEVRDALSLIPGLGDVDVHYYGDCKAFTYTVTMATKAGDQPEMTIDASNVTGNVVTTNVATVEDGSLWYIPIPGDMLSTVHSDPQVTVYINDVPTSCASGMDCSFTWSDDDTPTITAISPSTGAAGITVTITGTKFDSSGNSVTIGGTDCVVTSSSSTSIECTLPTGPNGAREVSVHVPSKGLASGSVTFTFTSAVLSISPTSGSRLGGLLLTITGYGFSSDATVTVGGKTCTIKSQTLTQIVCLVPSPQSSRRRRDLHRVERAVSTPSPVVVNTYGEEVASSTDFTYAENETPQISGLSSNSVKAWGGDVLTITGLRFGTASPVVTVNEQQLTVMSSSDTEVVVEFPPLHPGSFDLVLVVPNVGLAEATTDITIDITLEVTGLSPSHGSLYGGTLLTIAGQGFGTNASMVEVMVGSHACMVESVSDTEIQCRVKYTGAQVTVTNQGTHKDYGPGFAFDSKLLTIIEGDCVKWVWTTPSFVRGIGYGIKQTANDTSKETMEGGFASPGPSTANGQYKFCFNVPGDYHYWSGFVNSPYNFIYLRGKVTVNPRSSSAEELSVRVGGSEAEHLVPSGTLPVSSLCDYPKAGCTPDNLTYSDPARFYFTLDRCATPTVTSISLHRGMPLDPITFAGTGFGTSSNCPNEVSYAEVGRGVVTPVSHSELSFTIGTAGPPPTRIAAEFALRVGDFGNALMAISKDMDRRYVYLPAVTAAISPGAGSKAGGTLITIIGAGFSDAHVTVNNYECVVKSQSPTEVICSTPASQIAGKVNVEVFTSGSEEAIFCPESQCDFTYDVSLTPHISTVTPSSISSSPTNIVITGEGFGSSTDISVTLGGVTCTISSVTNTEVQCAVSDVPTGTHIPEMHVPGKGLAAADSSHSVHSQALISAISPLEGSTNGGTVVTITGHGFKATSMVTFDGDTCEVSSESATIIECVTSPHTAGAMSVAVTSNGVTYPSANFTFSTSATPTVNSVSPVEGQAGDTVVITGAGFSTTAGDNTVHIGGVEAIVSTATATSLNVILGNQITGTFPVIVHVRGMGLSNDDVTFEYSLGNVDINPTRGTTAGGQALTLSGSGFLPNDTMVTVCGQPCVVYGSTTATHLECVTPPAADNSLRTCDVVVTVNTVSKTAGSQYTYDPAITPEITSVMPLSGGTAGGTLLTIAGSGFGTDTSVVTVKVGTAVCDVQTVTATQITCTTNSASSGHYTVDVNVNSMGSARLPESGAEFRYIDKWSSSFTWGGEMPPEAGDLVQIPSGQIILLDVNTPVLSMLIIEGMLIFNESDVELHAERILITGNGTLQVGTEEKPFPAEYTAKIILHGHKLSKELPIYGTKVLALREGVLDLHGSPTPVTWTTLSATANAGATSITLSTPVNWRVGDQIVIPSTSHRHSQNETEVHFISAVSANGLTLNLRDPLVYKHVVVEHTFPDGSSVALRGEVGLLSHNVKVMGSVNDEWTEDIPRCEAGFDTGEFKTQTCFQGRFGAETESDQFGAHIIAHAPMKNSKAAVVRLSYIEITHAGQAFRLGRYPVHLHLNGDMSGSYVRGLGIHVSFNRAVNIHGTHNALVEHVVLYNIMGGAFFLEDGIETNNTFQYNLGTFIRPSSSLRNDDLTPAAFWVTNPDNIIIHNAAAGGSHFAYWYRMKDHPEGPSFDESICPKFVPLGRFENNTAHSFGWFALWIFEAMFPHEGGSCDLNAPSQVSIFKKLTAWNCDKGAETVTFGALQFKDFVLVNNEKAGFEGKLLSEVPQYNEANGSMVDGGMIVAHIGNELDQQEGLQCTKAGIVLPYGNGFTVRNVHFYNFDQAGCAGFEFTRVIGTCSVYCGGFTYETKGLQWQNSTNKVRFAWESEGVLKDLDGSLTNSAGSTVLPTTPSLPPSCVPQVPEFSQGRLPGSVCDSSVKFHRFSFNQVVPDSLEAKNALFTNQYGTTISKFAEKRITHKFGWMVVLMDGECYSMEFENAAHLTNISYNGVFYQFQAGDSLCLTQAVDHPDHFSVDGRSIDMSDSFPQPAEASHGTWWFDETAGTLSYYIKAASTTRRKREVNTNVVDLSVKLQSYTCFYDNCEPPEDPTAVKEPPSYTLPWSDPSSWDFRPGGKPQEGDNVTIPADKWLVIDEDIPPLDYLIIEGGLHAASDASLHFTLNVNYIIIAGRLIIGWENEPFNGTAKIILRGQQSSPIVPFTDGPHLGAKVMAVFGGLDLHGLSSDVKWTRLAATVTEGDSILTLEDSVDWSTGNKIMLTTTDVDPWHTETFTVTSVSGKSITVSPAVQHRHIAHSETLSSGRILKLSARVALLSRNIIIEGEDYANLQQESFGARVLVSRAIYNGISRNGFARVENTEFYHTGQEGFTEPSDPRFSLAFVDVLSDSTTDFYSYVRDNTFHDGFSPAVGVFAVDDLEVSGNVIHRTVGKAIHTTSVRTRVESNLMALTIWPGSYLGRYETFNIEFDGAVEAIESTDLVLRNNIVAGCERVGYRLPGQDCSTPTSEQWYNNEAQSCLIGVANFPGDRTVSSTCFLWPGFVLWKNVDWGLYINNNPSQKVTKVLSVENSVGYFSFVVGPSATSHNFANKSVELSNSIFVGRTSSYSCDLDILKPSSTYARLSGQSRSWRIKECGMVGVSFPTYTSETNRAPQKPLGGTMSYQTIKGRMDITGVDFELYGVYSGGENDRAITSNPRNQDMQHSVFISDVHHNMPTKNMLLFHHLTTGSINPSDCIDMNCDGLKKTMIIDVDGSFLGKAGYVLPNAGDQWDGDPAFGIGDYRIPKAMLNTADGSRIDVSVLAPYKGIFGHKDCEFIDSWNAFKCNDSVNYAMLIIESMDPDTETRRLSPIAVHSGPYIDLLNGPMDHGWCFGYTCRQRLSTFPAIVPLDNWVSLYMTSKVPDNLRFMLLNVGPTDCVGLTLWKADPYRLDVFVDGEGSDHYVMPTNGYRSGGRFLMRPEDHPGQYAPHLENKTMGENYVEFQKSTLYWVQCGQQALHVRRHKVLIVSFSLPAMTDEEFFGEQLINNIAQFLAIPVAKVRIVNIVRETSSAGGRKRRSTPGVHFFVEVGDDATDTSTPVDLDLVAYQIVKQVQLYGIDDIVNGTVLSTTILEPSAGGEGGFADVQAVGSLALVLNPAGAIEGKPFSVQPVLQVRSTEGEVVDYLGTFNSPWEVEVSLQSGGNGAALLLGTTTMTFVNGSASFTNLIINQPDDGYVLHFTVVQPAEASNYTLDTLPFQVSKRPVALLGSLVTNEPVINSPLQLSFRLVDTITNQHITDIQWRNHTWTVVASLNHQEVYQGQLAGTNTVIFDTTTGTAEFTDLRLTHSGVCPITFVVTSDPPEYTLSGVVEVPLMTPAQRDLEVEERAVLEVSLPLTYDTTTAPFFAALVRNYFSTHDDMRVVSHTYRPGSLVVTMTIEGTKAGVNNTLMAVCDNISNGTTFTYSGTTVSLSTHMVVNGQTFYGVSCYSSPKDEKERLHPGVIAAIVLACILLVAIIVLIVLWKVKVHPNTKTYDTNTPSKYNGPYRSDNIEDILFHENTFMSLKSHGTPTPVPPASTSLGADLILWRSDSDLPPMPGTPEPVHHRSMTPISRANTPPAAATHQP